MMRMNGKIPVQQTVWRPDGANEREKSRSTGGLEAGGRYVRDVTGVK